MPPYFPAVTSGYTFTQGVDISTEILAEAAGGVGGFRYGLSGLPDGLSFDPASRALSGASAADGDYSMTYTATDADGATASAAIAGTVLITITATDPAGETANHVVTIVAIAERYTREIPENSPPGSPVGAPVSGQVSGGVSPSHYQLLGPDASTFVIDPASGQISLANHTYLDYETKTSYDVYVLYNMGGATARIDVTIEVIDIAPPGTPGEPTVERLATDTPGEAGLRVTWTPPASGPVDGYVLRRLRDTLVTELASPYDKDPDQCRGLGIAAQHALRVRSEGGQRRRERP